MDQVIDLIEIVPRADIGPLYQFPCLLARLMRVLVKTFDCDMAKPTYQFICRRHPTE